MPESSSTDFNATLDRRLPYCTYAPEWAEHARFDQEDESCDDGRTGIVCESRKVEEPCPL